MASYEYRVVPAPTRGIKNSGTKGPEGRFANALEEVMNRMGAAGWEYQRAETLPSEERQGLTNVVTTYRNVLVFRRARISDPAPFQPRLLDVVDAHAPIRLGDQSQQSGSGSQGRTGDPAVDAPVPQVVRSPSRSGRKRLPYSRSKTLFHRGGTPIPEEPQNTVAPNEPAPGGPDPRLIGSHVGTSTRPSPPPASQEGPTAPQAQQHQPAQETAPQPGQQPGAGGGASQDGMQDLEEIVDAPGPGAAPHSSDNSMVDALRRRAAQLRMRKQNAASESPDADDVSAAE